MEIKIKVVFVRTGIARTVSDISKTVNTNTNNNTEIASASMETEKVMSAAPLSSSSAPMSPSTPTASMFINGEERLPENR